MGRWHTRKPDVMGGLTFPAGHARPAEYDEAIVGVGHYQLPTGHNY